MRAKGWTKSPRLGWVVAAAAWAAASFGALDASASTFDDDGRLSIDADTFAIDLDDRESLPEGFSLIVYDETYTPVAAPLVDAMFETDPGGLEGEGNWRLGGDRVYAQLTLGGLPDHLAGRRIDLRVWQRAEGTRAAIDVYFYGGDWEAAITTGAEGVAFYAGIITFRPTGKVTSDGWEEWATGPFDFEGPSGLRPSLLAIWDQQLTTLQSSYYAGFDPEARVRLDALEVVDLGPAKVAPASCRLVDEHQTCGDAGLCLYGRCVDAAIVAGAMPHPDHIEDYVARRQFEVRTFSGGRLVQDRMDLFDDALDPLKTDATPAAFWSTFQRAVADLRDGHASAPLPTYPAQVGVGACLHLGEADLLPSSGGAPEKLPLVFETNLLNPISAQLEVGDALTAIDGVPPAEWARLAFRLISHPGDPEAFDVVTTPDLINAASITGALLEFARCPSAAAQPCSDAELVRIEIDTRTVLGDEMWALNVPSWRDQLLTCDYRFSRDVDHPEVRSGSFAGAADDENGVRTLLINAVPGLYGPEGEAWGDAVRNALYTAPERLILDQRLGHGGSVDAVDLLAGMLVDPNDFSHMEMLPAFDRPVDEELISVLADCSAADELGIGCAAYFPWVLGETIGDEEGISAATKLAILIGSDVSGNDFTTKLLSYRSADTRVFGAAPTWGAFGVIWQLPAWQGELIGGSFQVHDTLFVGPDGMDASAFTTGVGVPPDDVVFQKQSDAVVGVDTVLEAARAWVMQ